MEGNRAFRLESSVWRTALIGIVVVRAILLRVIPPQSSIASYAAILYFLLLVLATGFAIRNGIQNTLESRPFWVLLAIAYGLWTLDQWLFVYYQFGLHIDVPDDSIADTLVFLHLVPLIAAATTLRSSNVSERKLYRTILNFLLLLLFWSFLYGYVVFPYQSLFSNATTYALRFDALYLLESLTLVFALGIFSLRARAPWKEMYLHLLGASTLYALSSAVANIAIDSGGYVNGKLYGLGLTASACWFVWIPLRARQSAGTDARPSLTESGRDSRASAWAMLAVLLISIPYVWMLLHKDAAAGIRTFQLRVAIAAIVGLAGIAYLEQYLGQGELASQIGLANERLRLAVQSGKSVGWEWDLKTGRDTWFGDLETMFGISSDTFVGRTQDFYRYVHPEDRQLVAKAVGDARQNRKLYAAEFRVVRLDGTMRWVSATGQFYYGANGDPLRMLGIAVDITERRKTEESLRLFRELIDESNDAIEVVDPKTMRFLDANRKCCRDLGYTLDELLSLSVSDIDPDEKSVARVGKEIKQTGSATFESVHRRKDGSMYPVEITSKRVELDRSYVISAVRDITERKRVEEAMRQKDEELTEAQRLAGLATWRWDPAAGRAIWSEEVYHFFGREPNLPPPPFKELRSLCSAESWARLQLAVKEALEAGRSFELDLELIVPGPITKWVIVRGEARRNGNGEIVDFHGTLQDITERKLAELERLEFSGKLIDFEEKGRSRLARELHDDFSQRLAVLAIDLERAAQIIADSPVEASQRLHELWNQASEIGSDLHSLSHRLHPSTLENLGLVLGVSSFCGEFAEQQGIQVDFTHENVPRSVPSDIALCLFRVTQEGLRNVKRHSGASRVEVRINGTDEAILLSIADPGTGFESHASRTRAGLGISSMGERLRLLGGRFEIHSQPGEGTVIRVWVPLTVRPDHRT